MGFVRQSLLSLAANCSGVDIAWVSLECRRCRSFRLKDLISTRRSCSRSTSLALAQEASLSVRACYRPENPCYRQVAVLVGWCKFNLSPRRPRRRSLTETVVQPLTPAVGEIAPPLFLPIQLQVIELQYLQAPSPWMSF
ncbi:unnamed protein product [Citrullus colocynthis]|uniref:Uncharacterized protein n=1 Tax=Citrullus colocynthis TaxID=252529 RepID=A0ABP0XNA8_9ROSI